MICSIIELGSVRQNVVRCFHLNCLVLLLSCCAARLRL